jgi:hypothetical protein
MKRSSYLALRSAYATKHRDSIRRVCPPYTRAHGRAKRHAKPYCLAVYPLPADSFSKRNKLWKLFRTRSACILFTHNLKYCIFRIKFDSTSAAIHNICRSYLVYIITICLISPAEFSCLVYFAFYSDNGFKNSPKHVNLVY